MSYAEEQKKTNRGASSACQAALASALMTEKDLEGGYLCDPTSKSGLRILARKSLALRLTRNLDKQRGFVNGALAVIDESLFENKVFIARLCGTGNYVLVHPMEEDGARFCPVVMGMLRLSGVFREPLWTWAVSILISVDTMLAAATDTLQYLVSSRVMVATSSASFV